MQHKLTPKQSAFVHEYMIDLNATQAAIRAGYSEKTANRIGAENLSKPVIQRAIREQQQEIERRVMITVEWVLSQTAAIAADEDARTVDRLKALELLGKHLGIWEKHSDEAAREIRVVFEDPEMAAWGE